MARTRAFTAAYSAVSTLADRALATRGGTDLIFPITVHGSPEACAFASRSFQTTFAAMRAQDRVRSAAAKHERVANRGVDPALTFARSEYDKLICQRRPLKDGSWMVSLIKAEDYMDTITIIDRETGEQIDTLGQPVGAATGSRPAPIINSQYDPLNVSLEDMFGDDE